MPGRLVPLVSGEIYHIYNRGSEKRDIFTQPRDYRRFQNTFYYYQYQGPKSRLSKLSRNTFSSFIPQQDKKLVEILAYCLMPNHFHFLVKQLKDGGISLFSSQLANSYTKYFNTKYRRVGSLFQGTFKSVLIESDEQFVHVSRYIHLNPIVSGMVKELEAYPWSSYEEYLSGNSRYCALGEVLAFFSSPERYKEFTEDQIAYGSELEIIKHQLIDIND